MIQEIAGFMLRTMQSMTKFVLGIVHRKRGERALPIDNALLLQSASDLARKIRNGEVSSAEVVEAFVRRIKQVNPSFNFLVDERFEESLQEARAIDRRIASGVESKEEMAAKQPFLGVPFTFKASIAKKGFSFSAGLRSRRTLISTEDAEVVTYMMEAGAIPLASTNISELCLWWESYNCVHGRTKNPYDGNRGVGGSSGGEGCILTVGGSPMGIGSDIGGSIRIPAHFNGVFGHKPTNGIGPLKGHFPFPRYPSIQPFLVLGPMSRFATDLLPMFKVTARNHLTQLRLDEEVDVTKLRYFYMEDDGGSVGISSVDPEIKSAVKKIVSHLKDEHGIEAQKLNLKGLGNSMMLWLANMKTPIGPIIAKELAGFHGSKNVYWELLKLTFGSRQHTFPVLVTAALEQSSMRYGDKNHTFFMNMSVQLKKELEDILGADGVFIYPTFPTPAPYHGQPMASPFDVSYTALFNWLGYPATHCPMGLNSKGLPIGVQVAAGEMQDRLTLAVAVELERAFGGWVPPKA